MPPMPDAQSARGTRTERAAAGRVSCAGDAPTRLLLQLSGALARGRGACLGRRRTAKSEAAARRGPNENTPRADSLLPSARLGSEVGVGREAADACDTRRGLVLDSTTTKYSVRSTVLGSGTTVDSISKV